MSEPQPHKNPDLTLLNAAAREAAEANYEAEAEIRARSALRGNAKAEEARRERLRAYGRSKVGPK